MARLSPMQRLQARCVIAKELYELRESTNVTSTLLRNGVSQYFIQGLIKLGALRQEKLGHKSFRYTWLVGEPNIKLVQRAYEHEFEIRKIKSREPLVRTRSPRKIKAALDVNDLAARLEKLVLKIEAMRDDLWESIVDVDEKTNMLNSRLMKVEDALSGKLKPKKDHFAWIKGWKFQSPISVKVAPILTKK